MGEMVEAWFACISKLHSMCSYKIFAKQNSNHFVHAVAAQMFCKTRIYKPIEFITEPHKYANLLCHISSQRKTRLASQ
jgi:hypothetical protein